MKAPFTFGFLDEDLDDECTYQLWDCTDRTTMSTMVTTLKEFIDLLVEKVDALTTHSFTAKAQAGYLKQQKAALAEDTAIVILDFAENYEYIIQHEVQSYHWSKDRCTIHPVSIYLKENNQLVTKSLCFMSDDLQHDTCFVYEVLRRMTTFCQQKYPQLKAIEYFSDGCAGQYKNYKNFMNLCLHQQDLNMSATWSFFATSHGKGPCDGIGGTVKRLARLESLRREKDFLNTFDRLYKFCEENIENVKFFNISAKEMSIRRPSIEARFQGGSTVAGTQSYHHFAPVDDNQTVVFKRLSSDTEICGKRRFNTTPPVPSAHYNIGDYVAVVYDREWYIGLIQSADTANQECEITFMHPKMSHTSLHWPQRQDKCLCPARDILTSVSVPSFSSPRARTYKLEQNEFDE